MNIYRQCLQHLLSGLLLLTIMATFAFADNMLALNIKSAPGSHSLAGFYEVRGYQFGTSITPYTVRYLGIYDWFEAGFANDHAVGLWRANGLLLASATIHSGTQSPLYAGFRWAKLSEPVILEPRSSFVIGATFPHWSNEMVRRKTVDLTHVVTGEGLYLEPYIRFTFSGAPMELVFPTGSISNNVLRFGPNLASAIVPFDDYDDSNELHATQLAIENGILSVLLSMPDPFKRQVVSHSTNLVENQWTQIGLIEWRENQPSLGRYLVGTPGEIGYFRVDQEDLD